MANVLFKRGTQAGLESIRAAGGVDGTFYLTNDTHRLYIGLSDNSIVPVNEGVITVAAVANLPSTGHAGEFYYATAENVLCVYNGTKWVQINPDTDTTIDTVTFSTAVASNKATVTNTVKDSRGTTKSASFSITGSGGVTVSNSGNDITINSKTYSFGSEATSTTGEVNLKLTPSAGDASTVKLKAGDHVSVTRETDGTVKIGSEVTSINSVTVSNKSAGFEVAVKDTLSAAAKSGSIDPVIKVGSDQTTSANTIHFANGTASLPVYSKSDIDAMMVGLNAMTFRGVLDAAPTSAQLADVHNGDVWKVGTAFDLGGVSYAVGDLLIAQGTEGTDGKIPAASVTWQRVSSGDGAVITYQGDAIEHGLKLRDSGNTDVASFALTTEANGPIVLTDATNADTKVKSVEVKHKGITKKDTTDASSTQAYNTTLTINPVVAVERDGYGHVTEVKTKTVNLKDTHNDVSAVAVTPTKGSASKVSLSTSVTTTDGTTKSGAYDLTSSSLTFDVTAKTATEPAKVSVDMVWGSF